MLREVLPALYAVSSQDLDLSKERALLARAQRLKIEIETAKLREKLVDVEAWQELYSKKMQGVRDKLRNFALRIAGEVTQCSNLDENYTTIQELVDEAL